jgi:hypothetical protein
MDIIDIVVLLTLIGLFLIGLMAGYTLREILNKRKRR